MSHFGVAMTCHHGKLNCTPMSDVISQASNGSLPSSHVKSISLWVVLSCFLASLTGYIVSPPCFNWNWLCFCTKYSTSKIFLQLSFPKGSDSFCLWVPLSAPFSYHSWEPMAFPISYLQLHKQNENRLPNAPAGQYTEELHFFVRRCDKGSSKLSALGLLQLQSTSSRDFQGQNVLGCYM